MSIYATIGDSDPAFFSSLQGWRDVTAWIEGMDDSKFSDAIHLAEHGYTDDAKALEKQLRSAIETSEPSKDVTATVNELLELLAGESGEVIIDSGMEESDGE